MHAQRERRSRRDRACILRTSGYGRCTFSRAPFGAWLRGPEVLAAGASSRMCPGWRPARRIERASFVPLATDDARSAPREPTAAVPKVGLAKSDHSAFHQPTMSRAQSWAGQKRPQRSPPAHDESGRLPTPTQPPTKPAASAGPLPWERRAERRPTKTHHRHRRRRRLRPAAETSASERRRPPNRAAFVVVFSIRRKAES